VQLDFFFATDYTDKKNGKGYYFKKTIGAIRGSIFFAPEL